MRKILATMKAELKELAETIKTKKKVEYTHHWRVEFRHKHIVYCLLRGRTMEQIEQKNRPHNGPQKYLLEKYWAHYTQGLPFGQKPVEEAYEAPLRARA